jgi:hypothetical protein
LIRKRRGEQRCATCLRSEPCWPRSPLSAAAADGFDRSGQRHRWKFMDRAFAFGEPMHLRARNCAGERIAISTVAPPRRLTIWMRSSRVDRSAALLLISIATDGLTCSVAGTDLGEWLVQTGWCWIGRNIPRAGMTPFSGCGASMATDSIGSAFALKETPANCSDDANAHIRGGVSRALN